MPHFCVSSSHIADGGTSAAKIYELKFSGLKFRRGFFRR
jgi:hypothetical protein